MTTDERSGFCAHCQRHVLGRRPGVNHVLHAIISIFRTWVFDKPKWYDHFSRPLAPGFHTTSHAIGVRQT